MILSRSLQARWRGSVGTVEEIDIPARKVRVKITMFGRELPAELELHQVKLF